jgi:chromosomal replication initiator protein
MLKQEACDMTTIHDIQTFVATSMGTTVLELLSSRRAQASAWPRHVAMWLCRHTTLHSLPEIGRAFGDRDHTTVMHAIWRVDQRMAADPSLAFYVRSLRETLTSREAAA